MDRSAKESGDRSNAVAKSSEHCDPALRGGGARALRAILVLAAAAGLFAAQPEQAAAAAWLQIDARADACISPDELTNAVEHLLDGPAPEGVQVLARARDQGWTVELRHATGQRAVREFPVLPSACAERLRALALAAALALEHAIAAPLARAASVDPGQGRNPLGWSLGIHAGASLRELPSPAPVLGVDARLERGAWVPVELRALADLRTSEANLSGAPFATRQVTGAVGSCLGGGEGTSWRADGCLGVELGAVLGRAESLPQAERDSAGSGALNLGLAARWSPRPHLALTARVEGFARFWVPRFQVLDAEGDTFAAYRLPPAGGRMWLGLSWLSR